MKLNKNPRLQYIKIFQSTKQDWLPKPTKRPCYLQDDAGHS